MDASLQKLKDVFDDKCAEINGRSYELGPMVHKQRKKVFAFFSAIRPALECGDMSFIDSERFAPIEKLICENVIFDGVQLSKLPDHWDAYPEDYLPFVTTTLGVISFPFIRGQLGV